MSHAIRCLFSLIFLAQLSACALFEERRGPPAVMGPKEQAYFATFEEVWRAANLVLQPYPLRISNMDQGILETDMIRGYKIWAPPFRTSAAKSGESYRLIVHVIRGNFENKPAIKVTILKDATVSVDFFSDPKSVPSTGLEESALLYRIGRELLIERALTKSQKKQNQNLNQNQNSKPQ